MTDYDPHADAFACYHEALRALRQIKLVNGAFPVESDAVDLLVLNSFSRATFPVVPPANEAN